MGNRPNAYLVYGYRLGGTDGWTVEGADDHGRLDIRRFDWAMKDPDTDDDVIVAANRVLEARGAGARITEYHGSGEGCGGGYYLRTVSFGADWDGDCRIFPVMLGDIERMNEDLGRALAWLDMEPEQTDPCWLLIATY